MIDPNLRWTSQHLLHGHLARDAKTVLQHLADSPYADEVPDFYGEGGATTTLETRVANLTGREGARFVAKGMIAQMAALRVHAEKSGRNTVAAHRLSHFDYDEMGAVERLHPLTLLRCGDHGTPFTVADLEALGELPGVVSVELPLRRAGYRLTPWDDLVAIADWCRAKTVPLHLDGARSWGAAIAYGRSLSEVAALGSSIYLSFYKELGGLAGCCLAGDKDFLAAVSPWIVRHGGELFRLFPLAISALDGLDQHLPHLGDYAARAREFALAINAIDGAYTQPIVPHTNGMQICLEVAADVAEPVLEELTRATGLWLAPGLFKTGREDHCGFDVEIGTASMSLDAATWADHIERLIEMTHAAAIKNAAE